VVLPSFHHFSHSQQRLLDRVPTRGQPSFLYRKWMKEQTFPQRLRFFAEHLQPETMWVPGDHKSHLLIALIMETVSTSETSVNIHQTTVRNIPEYSHLYAQRSKNLRSHLPTACLKHLDVLRLKRINGNKVVCARTVDAREVSWRRAVHTHPNKFWEKLRRIISVNWLQSQYDVVARTINQCLHNVINHFAHNFH
jgi:hypothetical protein